MLQILSLKLGAHVDIILGKLLIDFSLFFIHEGIELFDIELTFGEINIRVELLIYHFIELLNYK